MKVAQLPFELLEAASHLLQEMPAKHSRAILNALDAQVRVVEIPDPAPEPPPTNA